MVSYYHVWQWYIARNQATMILRYQRFNTSFVAEWPTPRHPASPVQSIVKI